MIQFCVTCGFFCGELRICRFCRDSILRNTQTGLRSIELKVSNSIHHRYLFAWRPNQDPAISRLALALKGSGSLRLWDLLAEEFFRKHPLMDPEGRSTFTFLPVPGLGPDHAFHWAQALNQCFHGRLELGETDKVIATKRLSRSERTFSRTQWKLPNLGAPCDRTLVIADDILTTGATARQLIKTARAQGHCGPIEVWTLIYRTALF